MNNFWRKKNSGGFTLVESIFYMAILGVLSITIFNSIINISNSFKETSVNNDLINSSYVIERLTREIRTADSVSLVSSNSLLLNTKDSLNNPVTRSFYWEDGNLRFEEDGKYVGNLNDSNMLVTELEFVKIDTPYKDAIKIFVALKPTSTISHRRCDVSECVEEFYDTVSVRGAVSTGASLTKSVTVSFVPSGGSVLSYDGGIDCGSSCSSDFAYDSDVILQAQADVGYDFVSWGGDCSSATSGLVCIIENINTDKTVTATFAAGTDRDYAVNVSLLGDGTGVVAGGSGYNTISTYCDPFCESEYYENDYVVLYADPCDDCNFVGWTGVTCPEGNDYIRCTIGPISSSYNITAEFDDPYTGGGGGGASGDYNLSVSRIGDGDGYVFDDGGFIDCGATCSSDFDKEEMVTLYAKPGSKMVFVGWTGGGCSGTDICKFLMDDNVTVVAEFQPSKK